MALVSEKESSLQNQTQFGTLGRTYPVSFCRSKKSLVASKKIPSLKLWERVIPSFETQWGRNYAAF